MARTFFPRNEARLTRFTAHYGPELRRYGITFFLGWMGVTALTSSHTDLQGSPLDWLSQAISVMSVGRITFTAAPHLIGVMELLLALLIVVVPSARIASIWAFLRLILGLAPLVMFRDELWHGFPLRPSGAGINVLAYVLPVMAALVICLQERWELLARQKRTATLLDDSRENTACRIRAWQRTAAFGLPTLFVAALAFRAAWPSYLRWFHNRQEAAVLDEKLSGKFIKKSMPPSTLLGGRKITTWVYLPPGYDRSRERYPVVYVMHGMPGEVRDCFVKGQIQDAAESLILSKKIKPLIIVGWDGEGPGGPTDITNYLDRPDYPMESFITRDLVPYIDRTYRTIPTAGARALDGISAGGYAAPNLVFKYPDIWSIGAAHNGFFDPADDAENMTAILGARGPQWDANNPLKLVNTVDPRLVHIYADIGQADDLLSEFLKFNSLLAARRIDHQLHVFPGRHTWAYWSQHFYDSLRFADARFVRTLPTREPELGAVLR